MEVAPLNTNLRSLRPGPQDPQEQRANASEVRDAYRQFVGTTFYGQMLKAMRSTLGKPAYFHGGRGEEVFRNQLDQQLADQLTAATADQVADPMFRHQFPELAAVLDEPAPEPHAWRALDGLARR